MDIYRSHTGFRRTWPRSWSMVLMSITCMTISDLIFLSQSATLPTFTRTPDDTIVKELIQDYSYLRCAASGTPTPKIQFWMKDGMRVVENGANFLTLPDGSLRVSQLHRSMEGYYQCVAVNSVGSVISKRAKLSVAYFDFVASQTNTETKRAGDTLILTVPSSIPCHPKKSCTYTWKKANQVLSEDDRVSVSKERSLYIVNLQISDQAVYSCEVTNTFLATTPGSNNLITTRTIRSTTLVLQGTIQLNSPAIVHPPQPVTAIQGDSEVKFECFVGGSPLSSTRITWKFNGRTLTAIGRISFGTYSKRLILSSPVKNDEGIYQCEAQYLTQPKVTGQAKLDMIVRPSFQKQPSPTTAFTDNSAKLWCNVTTGYPSFTTAWYINAVRIIPDNNKYIFSNIDRSLTVTKLSWSDAGGYQCLADNLAGQAILTGLLSVRNITATILRSSPSEVYEQIRKTTILICDVQGAPTPIITWLLNGVAIPENLRQFTQRSNGYLQITIPSVSDSGIYTCVAKNSMGEVRAVSRVQFLIPTEITDFPNGTITAEKGSRRIIPCKVAHDQRITVRREWRKNTLASNILTNGRFTVLSDGSLQLLNIHSTDEGTFSCHVFSKGGNVSKSATLAIVSLPLTPSTPTASEIGPYSLRLTWYRPGGDGGSAITAYELEIKNETETRFRHLKRVSLPGAMPTVVIRPLSAGKRYRFKVAAINAVGRSRFSDPTPDITTLTLVPSAPPSNIYAERSTQDTITLTWTPPPINQQNGDLQGYYIYYRLEGYTNSQFTELRVFGGALTKYTMTGLPTYTKYEIKMAAYNAAGVGTISGVIYAETKSGIPTTAPTNLDVSVVNSSAVKVAFNPPPQVSWNGRLDGVQAFVWFTGKPQTQIIRKAPFDSSQPKRQSVIFTELQPYTEYTISIAVYTASGPGPASSLVQFKTQEGSPGTPRDIMISGIYANAFTVSWKKPLQTSGILQGYIVSWKAKFNDYNWKSFKEPAFSTGAVIRNLQSNTQYDLKVFAFTNAGNGTEVKVSAYTSNVLPTKPSQPTQPKLYENNATSITLGWDPGRSGSVPLYYVIESNNQTNYPNVNPIIWSIAINLTRIQDIPARIPGLRPNTIYRFRVTAYNALGRSPTSNVSDPITTTSAAPLAGVTNLKAGPQGRQTLLIEWTPPPKDSWGSPFIRYIILFNAVGTKSGVFTRVEHPDSQAKSYLAQGLAKWTMYNITVEVSNDKGPGPRPGQSVLARTSEDVPDNGPANIVAVALNSSAINVTWGPVPVEIRHGIIKGYKVKYNIKGRPTTAENKTIEKNTTFTTLLNGLAGFEDYEVRINARTKSGESKFTDPVTVRTLQGVPGKPYKVRFPVVGLDRLQVTWQPPLRPNGVITGYEIRYKIRGATSFLPYLSTDARTRNKNIGGLAANVYYLFRIQARSNYGVGVPADELVLTTEKRETPEKPVILPITPSDVGSTSVTVKWVPGSDGKSPIRTFSLQYNQETEGWKDYMWKPATYEIPPSVTKMQVLRLLPARNYQFRVKATNDVGDSAWSDVSNTVTTKPDAPTGAPTHVEIKAFSSTSLLVKWRAPSYEDLNGILTAFLLKYRKQGSSAEHTTVTIPKDKLEYKIENLEVFTAYEVLLAARNSRGTGPWTPPYVVKTGEKVPTGVPYDVQVSVLGANDAGLITVQVKWKAPPVNTVNGYLLGYKIEYLRPDGKRRRRAIGNLATRLAIAKKYQFTNDMIDYFGLPTLIRPRRAVPSYCPPVYDPPLQTKTVGPGKTQAEVKALKMHTRYYISVRIYNNKGDGPKSATIKIHTPEGPPGPPHIDWYRPYVDIIEIMWKEPCHPNGVITRYRLVYSETSSAEKRTLYLSKHERFYSIGGLKLDTQYEVQLSSSTSKGFGSPAKVVVRTKITARLPGIPGRPDVREAKKDYALLRWQEGDTGNTPIVKYVIQYRHAVTQEWKTGWEPAGTATSRNKTLISYRVKDLKSKEQYFFRIIAVNKIGSSPPSESSFVIRAGERIAVKKPFYEEIWFIVLCVVVAILIITLIIVVVCIKRRAKTVKYSSDHLSTKDKQLQQQQRDLIFHLKSGNSFSVPAVYGDESKTDTAAHVIRNRKADTNDSSKHAPQKSTERSTDRAQGDPRRSIVIESPQKSPQGNVDNSERRYHRKPAETNANHTNRPGYSSFEMAMVRRESEQRLLNTDNESVHRSNRSIASQASKASKRSKGANDKLPNKNDRIDEVSVSSMSKHSDVSDNDADKSADETEDERKRWKLKEPDASIASHYANDPFYKSWRNSLDKKTRKAILAEYHKKAHQRDDEGSSESIANLKSMPRATSEERLDRPRGRPGRSDLSEKRKLTQSDPYLPQECEPSPASVSSFSPKERHRQAPRGRPGRRAIDRSVARSEPSLNRGSESDSDSRYPPPYEDNNLRKSRRQDSFLRATHGDSPVMRRSRDNISPEKSKKELIAELDNKVDRYTRYPPPYEDDYYSANESRPPPAYTPRQDSRQDSSDEGRSSYVGYQNNQRQWRPKRSDEDRNDRYRSPEFMERRVIHDDQFDGYEFDELDAPSRTSMTLV